MLEDFLLYFNQFPTASYSSFAMKYNYLEKEVIKLKNKLYKAGVLVSSKKSSGRSSISSEKLLAYRNIKDITPVQEGLSGFQRGFLKGSIKQIEDNIVFFSTDKTREEIFYEILESLFEEPLPNLAKNKLGVLIKICDIDLIINKDINKAFLVGFLTSKVDFSKVRNKITVKDKEFFNVLKGYIIENHKRVYIENEDTLIF